MRVIMIDFKVILRIHRNVIGSVIYSQNDIAFFYIAEDRSQWKKNGRDDMSCPKTTLAIALAACWLITFAFAQQHRGFFSFKQSK